MTYEEALDNVYGRLVFGIKPGLERISALLDRLGAPHKQLKFVHVAGTNGKGTCSTLVASALQACGLKVGAVHLPLCAGVPGAVPDRRGDDPQGGAGGRGGDLGTHRRPV